MKFDEAPAQSGVTATPRATGTGGAPRPPVAEIDVVAAQAVALARAGTDEAGAGNTGAWARFEALVTAATAGTRPRATWPVTLDRFPFRQFPILKRIGLRIMAMLGYDQRRALEDALAAVRVLATQTADLERRLAHEGRRWDAELRRSARRSELAELRSELETLTQAAVRDAEVRFSRQIDALELRNRLGAPTAAAAGQPAAPAGSGGGGQELDFTLMPGFYARFEAAFRGSTELVRRRQSVYLPLFAGQPDALASLPVADLGCGRGEWLDLLQENGVKTLGVDLNPDFLRDVRGRGHDVAEEDAVAWVARQPDASLRGITAFHVIEHISLTDLVRLLAEARRVLAPGGVLVFETPNPENLVVGACAFYIDPTHRRPVVPDLLRLLAEEVGFIEPRIMRLSEHRLDNPLKPVPADDPLAPTLNPMVEAVGRHLFAAPDYALVAVRA
ncbi:MAG TPA: class I SAM-dependent methyltransferase [Azospirillaceae bacterium]|nr:class I SAM-dependent methyltransferase [Azospirillaceae bacterium]